MVIILPESTQNDWHKSMSKTGTRLTLKLYNFPALEVTPTAAHLNNEELIGTCDLHVRVVEEFFSDVVLAIGILEGKVKFVMPSKPMERPHTFWKL